MIFYFKLSQDFEYYHGVAQSFNEISHHVNSSIAVYWSENIDIVIVLQ